ncbi:MAG: sensor histidine kinase [Saprospiraceae bacterium]
MIKTGNRNFWIAQIIGWTLFMMSNFFVQSTANIPFQLVVMNAVIPFVVGLLVTTSYRFFIKNKNWKNWSFGKMLLLILGSTFLLTAVFVVITFGLFILILQVDNFSVATFLSNFMIFFMVMLTWNMIYFCIHYFNNWTKAEVEKWKLAAEMKDAQLGSLKSQINPHFVFNTLNNIRSLILEDKEKAREMLLNFSDLFRYALKNTDQSKVSLEEELNIVNQYLELLSIQYEDKLQYKINVDAGLEAVKLPPMMLQLLVENAVKHGISQFKEGGSILIDIDRGNGFLNINVKNTGNLKMSSKLGDKLGVGLENIRKRLDLIYNGNANLKMSEVNEFVLASIKIPMI